MPRWLAYLLLAVTVITMAAAVVAVATGNGTLGFVALVVVGLLWVFTMRGFRTTDPGERNPTR
jgi:hypothetical protein